MYILDNVPCLLCFHSIYLVLMNLTIGINEIHLNIANKTYCKSFHAQVYYRLASATLILNTDYTESFKYT